MTEEQTEAAARHLCVMWGRKPDGIARADDGPNTMKTWLDLAKRTIVDHLVVEAAISLGKTGATWVGIGQAGTGEIGATTIFARPELKREKWVVKGDWPEPLGKSVAMPLAEPALTPTPSHDLEVMGIVLNSEDEHGWYYDLGTLNPALTLPKHVDFAKLRACIADAERRVKRDSV